MEIAPAILNNPLPWFYPHCAEISIKLKNSILSGRNYIFQPIWERIFEIHSLQGCFIMKCLNGF